MKTKKILITVILILSILCTTFTGCANLSYNSTPVSKTGFYFDTVITITLYGSESKVAPLIDHCFSMASYYESILSRTIPGSDIYNINNANGNTVSVSPDTAFLLSEALKYAQMSNGLVDPTIGSVSSLWDFHSDNPTIPDDALIKEACSHVNYREVKIDGLEVTLNDPLAMIDLGFIAKGFIADKMKEYLLGEDVKSGIINLGGNVLTIGNKPDNSPYQIGIQDPFSDAGNAAKIFSISDSSVVSSGSYERTFTVDGVKYHHILDTKTGYPVDTDVASVSVLSASSLEGDALSTYLFILGSEGALEYDNTHKDIQVFVIPNN